MAEQSPLGAGDIPALLAHNPLPMLSVEKEQLIENIKSAVGRKIEETAGQFKAHDRTISIASGGPSLEDTWPDLKGDIAAVNGSLRFLLGKGVTPWACGVLDPGKHMKDIVEQHPDVIYFVASVCDPSTFEHLKDCKVVIWHPWGPYLLDDLPKNFVGENDINLIVSGGSTMGLRWINLAYLMGFRKFHLHGMDSSFRGYQTHAYSDWRDGKISINVGGRPTTMNYLHQVGDFVALVDLFKDAGRKTKQGHLDDIGLKVHGEGLLQDVWRSMSSGKRDVETFLREQGDLS
jgi:hypothetical protein